MSHPEVKQEKMEEEEEEDASHVSAAKPTEPPPNVNVFHDVNTGLSNRGVWLVKVSPMVARTLENLPDDEQLGSVTINNDTGKVVLNLEGKEFLKRGVPQTYDLTLTEPPQMLAVLSEPPDGTEPVRDLELSGTVIMRGDTRPRIDANYKNIMRSRLSGAMVKKHTGSLGLTEAKDLDRVPKNETVQLISPTIAAAASRPEQKKRVRTTGKYAPDKRVRTTESDLRNKLFRLYEKEDFWTFKELHESTRQPEQFLKEILAQICIYHKRGEHRNLYELRPEYKQTADDATKTETAD